MARIASLVNSEYHPCWVIGEGASSFGFVTGLLRAEVIQFA
jgi:hypothetical protein